MNATEVSTSISVDVPELVRPPAAIGLYIVLPVMIACGLLGNIACLVTIYATKLHKLPANQYLTVLTLSDSVFLLTLTTVLLKLDWTSFLACVSIEYLLLASGALSSWTVATLTIERFLALLYPLAHVGRDHQTRTRLIMAILVPTPFLSSLVVFLSLHPNVEGPRQCAEYSPWSAVISVVDLSLSYLLPGFIVVVLNVFIACRLRMRTLNKERGHNIHFGRHGDRHCTKILVVMPVVYLVLNTPFYSARIQELLLSEQYQWSMNEHDLLYNTVFYMYYANFSCNFVVYAFSSAHFRQAACRAWQRVGMSNWCKDATGNGHSATSTTHASRKQRICKETVL